MTNGMPYKYCTGRHVEGPNDYTGLVLHDRQHFVRSGKWFDSYIQRGEHERLGALLLEHGQIRIWRNPCVVEKDVNRCVQLASSGKTNPRRLSSRLRCSISDVNTKFPPFSVSVVRGLNISPKVASNVGSSSKLPTSAG